MRRREVISMIGGAIAAIPLTARAQQSVPRVVGVLSPEGPKTGNVDGLVQGLRDLGYVEGQNIRFEYRWAEGKFDRLPELAADLVRQRVDVIVAFHWLIREVTLQAHRLWPLL
jgi:putative ABC transport system substrate-binding protein